MVFLFPMQPLVLLGEYSLSEKMGVAVGVSVGATVSAAALEVGIAEASFVELL